jgi:hypothetical protein
VPYSISVDFPTLTVAHIERSLGIAAHFVRYLFFFPKQSNGKKFSSWLILRNWWLIFG